jgi:ribosomal protein L5
MQSPSYICLILSNSAVMVVDKSANPMHAIKIEKLVLNMVPGGGDKLTRAASVLKELTDQQPVFSKGKYPGI